jgi:hypothetical protein
MEADDDAGLHDGVELAMAPGVGERRLGHQAAPEQGLAYLEADAGSVAIRLLASKDCRFRGIASFGAAAGDVPRRP